ncbi:MAG: hypothetical protein IJ317_03355 [Clostridia bacterium]|nr:hypothetical protein [Clostridia bacterium]
MYCKQCGKFIGTDEDLCYDCKSAQRMEQRPVEPTPQPQQAYAQPAQPQAERAGSVMTGFGKALAGSIVSVVSFVFLLMGLIHSAVGYAASAFLVWGMGVAGGVVSLIFGIQSIKCFKRESAADRKKPIPALVLGIETTVCAAISLAYFSFFFFIILDLALMVA